MSCATDFKVVEVYVSLVHEGLYVPQPGEIDILLESSNSLIDAVIYAVDVLYVGFSPVVLSDCFIYV